MSKTSAKWRKSNTQRAQEQLEAKQRELERVREREEASPTKRVSGKLLLKPTRDKEDPLAGVISERLLLLSTDSDGNSLRCSTRPWEWLPPSGADPTNPTRLGPTADPEVNIHGDGWTTAHPGPLSVEARGWQEELLDEQGTTIAMMHAAGLSSEEVEVLRLQAARDEAGRRRYESRQAVADALGMSFRQVLSRVHNAGRKLLAYGEALKKMQHLEAE